MLRQELGTYFLKLGGLLDLWAVFAAHQRSFALEASGHPVSAPQFAP